MIKVTEADEPVTFNNHVRAPGLLAISELVGEKPKRQAGKRFPKVADSREEIPPSRFPPYWTECLDDMMRAYSQICAYSCFRIHAVTGGRSVDHMVAKSQEWAQVYEWNNYRLVCSKLNSRKNSFDDVLDPFEIETGWFQMELLGFTLHPDRTLSSRRQRLVQNTIERLGLDDFKRDRADDAEAYWSKEVTLRRLQRESPLVAIELQRQGRLNPQDAP